MLFGKKKNWDEVYDEDYAARADRRDRFRSRIIWHQLFAFFLVVAFAVGSVWVIFGKTMFEKVIIELVAPVGLVWLLLMFQMYIALIFRQSWFAVLTLIGWLLLTVFGNSYVANQLSANLERPHVQTTLDSLPKLDAIFLLGGGTETNPQGRAQGNASGDRVLTAAYLYHMGKVPLIICTGEQSFRTNAADLDPREEAKNILLSLDVPDTAIMMMRGKNTYEEMQNAAVFLEQREMTDARIGIVTSAWHLNRAGRLAQSNGLQPVLIPADFRASFFNNGPGLIIPGGNQLATSARCIKEHLAALAGR